MQKLIKYLLLIFLFLLPWQTRYIWHYGELNGGFWEYGTFSIYATEILLWIILLLFFVQHFLNKSFWVKLKEKKSKRGLAFILFLVFLAFSTVLSNNFWVSYNYAFHILEAMALMVVLSGVIPTAVDGSLKPDERDSSITLRSNRNDRLTVALWLGGVVQGALAIYQFLTQNISGSKWLGMAEHSARQLGASVVEFGDQRWLRAYGGFGSPNSLGIYLVVLFVLGLVLYLKTESARIKIVISVGQIFILSGLLVSFSRGAWIAAVAGVAVLFVVVISPLPRGSEEGVAVDCDANDDVKSNGKPPLTPPWKGGDDTRTALKQFIKQILFALAVVIFWLIIFYPVFTARFNFNNRLEAKSISERKGQYTEVLSFIKSNPVLGVGPGAYTLVLWEKYPKLPSWQYQPVHNIYLLAMVEWGLAGAIMLIFLFGYLLEKIIAKSLWLMPAVVTLLAAGIFDHWLASMYTGIIFLWVIIGLGLSSSRPQPVDKNLFLL